MPIIIHYVFYHDETEKKNPDFRGPFQPPKPSLVAAQDALLTCTVLRFVGAIGTVAAAVAVFDGRHAPNGGGGGGV